MPYVMSLAESLNRDYSEDLTRRINGQADRSHSRIFDRRDHPPNNRSTWNMAWRTHCYPLQQHLVTDELLLAWFHQL